MKSTLDILQKVWGYPSFRPPQDEIIDAQIQGKDVLALLPTGAGKSICYQVPALAREGLCLVISPLIALMKDQVSQLKKRNVNAEAIFSGITEYEIDRILNNCATGHTKILYVSPERLKSPRFEIALKGLPVSMIAVDEAHCISQWGFDFRPSYRNIADLRNFFPHAPIVALTASATPEVQKDIIESLKLKNNTRVFKASFKRENISFVVRNHESKAEKLLEIIQKVPGTAIVYTTNRKRTEEIAKYLMSHGISASFYHAGLSADDRNKIQEDWIANRVRVICCTNAFGMGIDKPDVRLVAHVDVPESLEAYYQEAGRAGRDGKRSYAVLLFNEKDKEKLIQSVDAKFPDFDFVKSVYNALFNHLNIALSGGKGHSFEFNLIHFTRSYKWDTLQVYNALKLLEKSGYLTLGEAFYRPSLIKFELERIDLYKFQVANMQYDIIIKALLRTYEGAINNIVKINELYLARKLMITPASCSKMLQELSQKGVLTYIPSSDKPRIFFLEERLRDDNLRLDFDFINFTKKQMKERIKAMLDFAEADMNRCRQYIMRSYFGEKEIENCGTCDNCIKKKQLKSVDTETMRKRLNDIISPYGERGIQVQELYDKLGGSLKEQYLEMIRILIDEEQLIWVDESQQYIRVQV